MSDEPSQRAVAVAHLAMALRGQDVTRKREVESDELYIEWASGFLRAAEVQLLEAAL